MVSLTITVIVYVGCKFVIGFHMAGSYVDMIVVFVLGALSLVSRGVLLSSWTASEEFAGGILNLTSWPMMFLSGVWFSLEGSPSVVVTLSKALPLTQMVDAARAIMTEGKSLPDLTFQIVTLAGMTVVFLALGSYLFRWSQD